MILLLNQDTISDIFRRLDALSTNDQPLFGKMNPAEMMKHCTRAIEIPLGIRNINPHWFFKLVFGRWVRTKILSDEIYAPNQPTAPEFKIHDKSLCFEEEKGKLASAINEFVRKNDSEMENVVHGLIGKLSADEWRKSQWKHLDHHLRQFGR